jgi:hypothetical protein
MPAASDFPSLELYMSVDEAVTLEAALAAFDAVTVGAAPTARDLAAAPRLVDWRHCLVPTVERVLIGTAEGHPRLPGRRSVVTSPLLALDAEAGWARTVSRFYRLGRSLV